MGKYIRQAQNKLQTPSLLEQKGSGREDESPSLLEKMLARRIHVDDISTLLMDIMILGVQAVIRDESRKWI